MMSDDRYWELHGKLHREDGPALEFCAKGRLRRPEATTMPWVGIKGDRFWFRHGYLHREDGPAREYPDGIRQWYLHGKYHREDGPAYEYPDGTRQWYWHGELAYVRSRKDLVRSQEEFNEWLIQEVQES